MFKTLVDNIIEAIPFLIEPISYEPKTLLLQVKKLKHKLNDAYNNYKSAIHHPSKYPLLAIDDPLKILTGNLKDYHTHTYTALNINTDIKDEATIKYHLFQTDKNNMADAVPPTMPGGSCTTTSFYEVRITYKTNR